MNDLHIFASPFKPVANNLATPTRPIVTLAEGGRSTHLANTRRDADRRKGDRDASPGGEHV